LHHWSIIHDMSRTKHMGRQAHYHWLQKAPSPHFPAGSRPFTGLAGWPPPSLHPPLVQADIQKLCAEAQGMSRDEFTVAAVAAASANETVRTAASRSRPPGCLVLRARCLSGALSTSSPSLLSLPVSPRNAPSHAWSCDVA